MVVNRPIAGPQSRLLDSIAREPFERALQPSVDCLSTLCTTFVVEHLLLGRHDGFGADGRALYMHS